MTLPPASANRSSILALTSGGAPQPQSSPKVIVPSATSEIRTPVLPKSLYFIRFPHSLGWAAALLSRRVDQSVGSNPEPVQLSFRCAQLAEIIAMTGSSLVAFHTYSQPQRSQAGLSSPY